MTPRQRWLALLDRQQPDRIPTDYQATPEVTARLLADLGCAGRSGPVAQAAHRQAASSSSRGGSGRTIRTIRRPTCGASAIARPTTAAGPTTSRATMPLADGRVVAEVHAHRWPDPDDFDYGVDHRRPSRPTTAYGRSTPAATSRFCCTATCAAWRRAFEDLALRPEIADAILGHIFDFHYEHHRRIFEAGRGRIDMTWVAEDLGAQTGPLMSLAMYRRFLLPNQIRMADLARSFGIHVMYHTDGAARLFLPDLIDRVGIEILNPIQWRCPGMERERLVADFGDRIIFHGSIDNQQTLAFGTRRRRGPRGPRERRDLPRRPLDLRPVPQPPADHADGEHRGDVRDDPRVWGLGTVARRGVAGYFGQRRHDRISNYAATPASKQP